MKLTITLIALIAVFMLAVGCGPLSGQGGYENVDVATFKKMMEQENVVLLDVRTPPEIAAGKIEGALEADVKNLQQFDAEIAKLDKSKTYLVYCRSGRRSQAACQLMNKQGFENLYNLSGGYLAWQRAVAAGDPKK